MIYMIYLVFELS